VASTHTDLSGPLVESHPVAPPAPWGEADATLRRELREARRQLQDIRPLAELGEIVAFVAHELRNPLAGIAATAEVLAESFDPDDDRLEGVNIILREAERLETAVRNLLDFARHRRGKPRPLPLPHELTRVAKAVERLAREAKVRVHIEAPDQPREAIADPELLYHALLNLATNAIQATPPGGSLTMRVLEPDAGSDFVCVEFADTGCGIPRDDLANIFEPFFTTRSGGIGLGLAAAARIVEHLGGHITVESIPGVGSTFTVWLRRADLPEARS